jgi:hypothetical protein
MPSSCRLSAPASRCAPVVPQLQVSLKFIPTFTGLSGLLVGGEGQEIADWYHGWRRPRRVPPPVAGAMCTSRLGHSKLSRPKTSIRSSMNEILKTLR